jgi:hypothetical protein
MTEETQAVHVYVHVLIHGASEVGRKRERDRERVASAWVVTRGAWPVVLHDVVPLDYGLPIGRRARRRVVGTVARVTGDGSSLRL